MCVCDSNHSMSKASRHTNRRKNNGEREKQYYSDVGMQIEMHFVSRTLLRTHTHTHTSRHFDVILFHFELSFDCIRKTHESINLFMILSGANPCTRFHHSKYHHANRLANEILSVKCFVDNSIVLRH